jgi:GTP:adenosylcobinamide-phosphate guanylyltransferase
MQTTCEGIILSGGLNRRMQGRNKALLELNGRSFLERIVTTLTGCFEQLLLVTKKPEFYKSSSSRTAKDIIREHIFETSEYTHHNFVIFFFVLVDASGASCCSRRGNI